MVDDALFAGFGQPISAWGADLGAFPTVFLSASFPEGLLVPVVHDCRG
jgi:hypothetical protein